MQSYFLIFSCNNNTCVAESAANLIPNTYQYFPNTRIFSNFPVFLCTIGGFRIAITLPVQAIANHINSNQMILEAE